jgi:type II secretory pathway pseudopilin PulG
MMVAIAIFMVVAVVAVAALLKIVDADRKSQTLQDAVNNINFAMDSITREIRVGSDYNYFYGSYGGQGVTLPAATSFSYSCNATSCTSANGISIIFLSSKSDPNDSTHNLTYAYYFAPNPNVSGSWTIEKAQQTNYGDTFGGANAQYAPIIDPSIVITAYTIKVNVGNSLVQPSVFFYIKGYTGKDVNTQTYFDLQTTISERI